MIFRRLHFVVVLVILFGQSWSFAKPPESWGYLGWWFPQSAESLPLSHFDRLLFFDLKVSVTGEIADRNGWPEEWKDLQSAVLKSATPLDLTLTLFNPEAFNGLFLSPIATERLLAEALTLSSHSSIAGLQLDFELFGRLHPDAITGYRVFLGNLAERLKEQIPPRNLSVFFAVGAESNLYDEATLKHVDHVVLQGYDTHWRGSKSAGPVAPLSGNDVWTWEKSVAYGVTLGVPRTKVLIGFPLYGYEWQVDGDRLRGATLSEGVVASFATVPPGLSRDIQINIQQQVSQYGSNHDTKSGSAYYQFRREGGQFVEGWFEDPWSLDRKIDFVVAEQLVGIAFFLVGYDGGQLVDHFAQRRASIRLSDLASESKIDGATATRRGLFPGSVQRN